MTKVLVTSGNTRVAYAICCSLAENNFQVHIGDGTSFTMAGMSRHCKGRMTYPSPFTAQEAFIDSVIAYAKAKNISILLPVLEETFTCLKYKSRLEDAGLALLLPSYEQALQLHAKGTLTEITAGLGLDTPPTWELSHILSGDMPYTDLPYPIIVKPKQGGGGWGMQKFSEAADFLDSVSKGIENPQNYIVQAIVQGQLIGVCGIFYKGEHIASDSYISTTVYPLRVGQPTTRISKEFSGAIAALKTLLNHMQWHGVCEIDFIYDEKNNKNYLIDANPRFWGSIKQNIAAGVNYPLYYALLAQGNTNFTPPKAQEGTRSRWLGGDILRVLAEFCESKQKIAYIREALQNPKSYAANDDWRFSDPLPFMTWGVTLVLNKVLRRKKDSLPGVWE